MALQMVQVCNEQHEHSNSASAAQPLTTEPELQTTLGTKDMQQDRTQPQKANDTACDATDSDSNDSEDNQHAAKFHGKVQFKISYYGDYGNS